MNIVKELWASLGQFKRYVGFLENRKRKVFCFGLLLMFLYFSITILVPVIRFQVTTGGIAQIADEIIPEFEWADGTLWVERPVEYEFAGTLISIDTAPDSYLYDVDNIRGGLERYDTAILMDAEKCILKSKGEIGGYYLDEFDVTLTKAQLLEYVPMANLILIAGLILLYLWMTLLFFLGVLVVALFGMIVASCMGMHLTFGQIYLLAVYARTLPLLIKGLLSFLPFGISFFWIFNFGLSLFYLSRAFYAIKVDTAQKDGAIVIETGQTAD